MSTGKWRKRKRDGKMRFARCKFSVIVLPMETDSFFWQLLKKLPETLFALLGLPIELAASYRFDAVEIKKSYRLDGIFVPAKRNMPLYFVEAQFRRDHRFYPNLFAKVFSYLEANDSNQDWIAVALFPEQRMEPKRQAGCDVLRTSRHVQRIYLDQLNVSDQPTPGLKILQLVAAPMDETRERVSQLLDESRQQLDCERGQVIVELVEELLMRRFTELNRQEVRQMFQLHDLRESKVWQEAHNEGLVEGVEKGVEKGMEKGMEKGQEMKAQEFVRRMQSKGMTLKAIAELLELPLADVRRLARVKR